jgi:hypothetical protein
MDKPEKIFDQDLKVPQVKRGRWKQMLPVLILLIVVLILAKHYDWDANITTAGALLFGVGSGLVTWLLSMIAVVPVVGPIIVKVVTMSFIWLLNAIGYCVSYIAIRRGYSKDVLTYRAITIALLVGIVIGYVIARLIA